MKFSTVLGLLLIATSVFLSCARVVVNSAQNDELQASVSKLQGGPRFKSFIPVIHAKCATCHTHSNWYGYNENDYLSDGLVIAADPVGSALYYRLSSTSDGAGPHNMPQGGGAALTASEVDQLVDWINNIGL